MEEILNVIQLHQFFILRGRVLQNYLYVSPRELSRGNIDSVLAAVERRSSPIFCVKSLW